MYVNLIAIHVRHLILNVLTKRKHLLTQITEQKKILKIQNKFKGTFKQSENMI